MKAPYFIGIDIGTQGARLALVDAVGNLLGSCQEAFPLSSSSREEQSPEVWWACCLRLLQALMAQAGKSICLQQVLAVSVTSTSGTVIPLDGDYSPLHKAIMYSDQRSAEEAEACRQAALRHVPEGYTGFNTSSGLSKMVWYVAHFPEKARKLRRWVHAADYIIGRLSGRFDVTDHTNALKSGYDVRHEVWPAYLHEQLPLRREWLQEVVPSGTPVGTLLPALARQLGLRQHVQVVAGMTDGCASQIASGAVRLGDWNSTIGTTLVVKGVTRQEVVDPEGRLYNHRHPQGYWMPGGASNTGADWVAAEFSGDLEELSRKAEALIPSGLLAWPLRQKGERFPFIAPDARGFEPEGLTRAERFVANMEGVAYVERYAFELIERLSNEKVKAVYTAGGGSNSEVWLRIRSNVLNLPVFKMRHVSGAVGAAILAASNTYFTSIAEAAGALTQVEKEVYPARDLSERYEEGYREFIRLLQQQGYIHDDYHHA